MHIHVQELAPRQPCELSTGRWALVTDPIVVSRSMNGVRATKPCGRMCSPSVYLQTPHAPRMPVPVGVRVWRTIACTSGTILARAAVVERTEPESAQQHTAARSTQQHAAARGTAQHAALCSSTQQHASPRTTHHCSTMHHHKAPHTHMGVSTLTRPPVWSGRRGRWCLRASSGLCCLGAT